MTTRLYYTDALRKSFEANVVACERIGEATHVVLDETAFYPTSGGQPFDTGTLGGHLVIDVIDRADGTVTHVLGSGDPSWRPGTRVSGAIDWTRRFDHMQQHTGQHILSAAFDNGCGVRTMSFHLGAETSTIDLAREVTPAEMAAAEDDANRVVWDDRPIGVRFVTEAEAATLPLRKEPARAGVLRLVDVPDCDLSACGGTHVPRTGVVGIIAISAWERVRGGTRVTFVCGGRALASHRRLRDIVSAATRPLSIGAADLPATIDRLQQEQKGHQRAMRALQGDLAGYLAASLRASAVELNGRRVVTHAQPGWDASAVKSLAAAIVSAPGLIAIVVGEGEPTPVIVTRSTGVDFDCAGWLKTATAALGGRGGGKPELAQGGITAAPDAVLAYARRSSVT